MSHLKSKSISAVLIAAFFVVFILGAPLSAEAKWDDRSDELPGLQGFPTGLLIAAGVLAAGGIILLIAKKGKDKTAETPTDVNTKDSETDSTETATDSLTTKSADFDTSLLTEISKPKLGLFVDLDPGKDYLSDRSYANDLKSLTVKAGFTIGF